MRIPVISIRPRKGMEAWGVHQGIVRRGWLMVSLFFSLSFFLFAVRPAQTVDYPYINYGLANRHQTNGEEWQQTARLASLERFEPQNLGYFSDHLVDVYEEAATIARPPMEPSCRRPLSNKTGYIICVYKVFEGDDGEKFERNWLYWTGNPLELSSLSSSFQLFLPPPCWPANMAEANC